MPQHPVILQAARQDYDSFYADEIKSEEAGTLPTVLHPLPGGIFRGTGKGVRGDCGLAKHFGQRGKELPGSAAALMNLLELWQESRESIATELIRVPDERAFFRLMWEMLRAFDSEKNNRSVHSLGGYERKRRFNIQKDDRVKGCFRRWQFAIL